MSQNPPNQLPLEPGVGYDLEDLRRVYCIMRGAMAIYGGAWSLPMLTITHQAISSLGVFLEGIALVGPAAGVADGKIIMPSETFADVLEAIRGNCYPNRDHPMAATMSQLGTDARMQGRQAMRGANG